MVNRTIRTFETHAPGYDAARRRLVPCHDAFYAAAVDALALARVPVERVLDLGAGTGALSAPVAEALPDAEVVLLDGAPAMLALARERLGDRASYVESDLTAPLPSGPWHAIVSALAIHHLDDADKAALYARVHDALEPGGVFVNAEQVAGPTESLEALYEHRHEADSRALGASDADWAASLERRRHDRCASVEDQLRWLRDAGFGDADCLFKELRFAVLFARR